MQRTNALQQRMRWLQKRSRSRGSPVQVAVSQPSNPYCRCRTPPGISGVARKTDVAVLPFLAFWKIAGSLIYQARKWLGYLQALAEREDAVRDGRLQTVIFVRTANAEGQEVSGYIDFGHRCSHDPHD